MMSIKKIKIMKDILIINKKNIIERIVNQWIKDSHRKATIQKTIIMKKITIKDNMIKISNLIIKKILNIEIKMMITNILRTKEEADLQIIKTQENILII
jgi:hypothetical protein